MTILESYNHCPLINWWKILELKWHDHLNESSPIADERNLIPIFKGNHDLVIFGKSIQKTNRHHVLPLHPTPL